MNMTPGIRSVNPTDNPMTETHFYLYLEILEPAHGSKWIDILEEYLGTFGFKKGRDSIDHELLEGLRFIHSEYWRKRLPKPAWLRGAL